MKTKPYQYFLFSTLLIPASGFAQAINNTNISNYDLLDYSNTSGLSLTSSMFNTSPNYMDPYQMPLDGDINFNTAYTNVFDQNGFNQQGLVLGIAGAKSRSPRTPNNPYNIFNYNSDPFEAIQYRNTRISGLNYIKAPTEVVVLNPNSANDSQVFSEDMLFCPVDTSILPNDFLNLGQEFDFRSCFNMRQLSISRNRDPSLIQTDKSACNCLQEKSLAQSIMNQPLSANQAISDEAKSRLRDRVQDVLQQQLSSTMNGLFFTSAVVYNEEMNSNAEAYAIAANVYTNSTTNVEGDRGLDLRYAPDFQQMFLDSYPLPANQCLSKQEYFRMRMIPEGRDLEIIKNEMQDNFIASDWDYKILEEQYREIMDRPPRERQDSRLEILSFKAKLKFLNRNPMIKYYLGNSLGTAELKSGIFDQMKRSFSDPGCQEITSACTENFHKGLEGLLKNAEARALIRNEAREDINKRVKNEASSGLAIVKRSSRDRRPDRNKMIADFQENFGLNLSPDDCHVERTPAMDEALTRQCLQVFSAYCKRVDTFEDELNESNSNFRGLNEDVIADIQDDLDETLRNDFNPSLANNPDFERLNELHCGARSAGRGILRDRVDFREFLSDKCRIEGETACRINNHADLVRLRQEFYKSHPVARNGSVEKPAVSLSNGSMVREVGTQRYFTAERPSWDMARKVSSFDSGNTDIGEATNVYSNVSSTLGSQINNLRNETEQDSNFNFSNYSNLNAGAVSGVNNQVVNTDTPRVQDMDQERRQELLNDWEKEYNQWKENKGSSLTPGDQAQDTQLRTEISTLKALLDQQRQISDQQFQLLNDAIAAKTRLEQDNIARTEQQRERSEANRDRVASGGTVGREALQNEVARGPASIPEQQLNTSGSAGGSATAGAASVGGGSGPRSSAAGPSGSSDSVAREEAKLVNLRENSDGSIIIISNPSAGNSAPNAIRVPVSDETYRILETNPRGLNLSQIENSIPREQIAQLDRNGAEIILLLSNGQNPPYEVKVKKQDNRLVYSVVDQGGRSQAPVRRVNTFSALKNTLNLAQ